MPKVVSTSTFLYNARLKEVAKGEGLTIVKAQEQGVGWMY